MNGPTIAVAVIGVAGLVLGAILQFYFTRYLEIRKERRESLLKTYNELLDSLHSLASAQASKAPTTEVQLRFERARTAFLLYGHSQSIRMFVGWTVQYGKLNSKESKGAFAAIINQMRTDCNEATSDISEDDIRKLLFGDK